MPVYQLGKELWFPPEEEYEEHGIVAIEGDLSTDRLLLAYSSGIFPWYNEDEPIMWWCPAKRMVLKPSEVKVSKSSRNLLNRQLFKITYNTAFEDVINACQKVPRKGQDGTWLNDELKESYLKLHEMGYAQSVECWQDDQLVGGLYGLAIGKIFCGDSMFSRVSNASKIAFIHLARKLEKEGFKLIDCQVYNDYLASLGAYEIPRREFLEIVRGNVAE